MIRAFALFALMATPLIAQDKETLCATSGGIVGAAVTERISGADAATARSRISDDLPEEKGNFRPAVEPLVDWVYSLAPEQVTDELAATYLEQCLAN